MLNSCKSFAPSAWKILTLKQRGTVNGRDGDHTRGNIHVRQYVGKESAVVAVLVCACWDAGVHKSLHWHVVGRSADETKALLSADYRDVR